MSKKQQLEKMKDMIYYNLNDIKTVVENFGKEDLFEHINSDVFIEIIAIIKTVIEFTNITEEEVNNYLQNEINMDYKELNSLF